ncbi:hypothetical protein Hanom_Chr05g00452471 [Helianthus anomalus]
MNKRLRIYYRTFPNTIGRTRPLFVFVYLTRKFFLHVCLSIKWTNVNELPPIVRPTNHSLDENQKRE